MGRESIIFLIALATGVLVLWRIVLRNTQAHNARVEALTLGRDDACAFDAEGKPLTKLTAWQMLFSFPLLGRWMELIFGIGFPLAIMWTLETDALKAHRFYPAILLGFIAIWNGAFSRLFGVTFKTPLVAVPFNYVFTVLSVILVWWELLS